MPNRIPPSARYRRRNTDVLILCSARVLALGLGGLLLLPACRPSAPVEEVSVRDSGVQVSQRDVSTVSTDWPQWRGPRGDGVAASTSVPTQWSETENIAWRSDVPGRGHSSPIVVGDLVVLGTAREAEQQQLVLAFDRETGQQRWSKVIHEGGFPGRGKVHRKGTHANSTLASDGQRLITTHLNRDRVFVTALDRDGNQLWQRDVGAFASKFGYAPSPVLYESLVIVAADNFGGGYLVALDSETGKIAWKKARGDASSYSSPHVATVGGVDQVLISGGERLASYDPATGELLWETRCIAESTCGTVVTTPQRIFASGGYPDKETVALSPSGQRLWSDRTKVYEPSLVTDGSRVYAVTDNGIAMCWSGEDGRVLWRERLGGEFSSSPVLVNGMIYVADLSGRCYVFEATGEAYREVAVNRLGDDCYASPAVVDGALFLRVGLGQGSQRREQLVKITAPAPQ